MVGEEPLPSRPGKAGEKIRAPPDMIDAESDAERANVGRVETVEKA
jgi:hypothetical protein